MATNEDETDDPFACFDSSDDDDDDDDDDNDNDDDNDDDNDNDDDDDNDNDTDNAETKEQTPARDPENGVLAFHSGTEVALLHWVRTELDRKTKQQHRRNATEAARTVSVSAIHRASTVLELVDAYCLLRHWMMHVGPEKAGPLRGFLASCLSEFRARNEPPKALTVLELGTYCGYSSIFFAKTLLELLDAEPENDTSKKKMFFHIYSIEVVEGYARVARELIRLAGMEDLVTVILVDEPEDAHAVAAAAAAAGKTRADDEDAHQCQHQNEYQSSSLSSALSHRVPRASTDTNTTTNTTTNTNTNTNTNTPDRPVAVDFLFVDHDKSLYLTHLQELERTGWLRAGTHVAADNVVFAQIDDYRGYMAERAGEGIVETRLEDSLLIEYCQPELAMAMAVSNSNPDSNSTPDASAGTESKTKTKTEPTKNMLRDGIEFSVYLKDP